MTPLELEIVRRMATRSDCTIVDREMPPAIYLYDADLVHADGVHCGMDITRETLDRLLALGMIEDAKPRGAGFYQSSEKGRSWVG